MASADGAQTLNWTVLVSMSMAPRSKVHGLGGLGFMGSEFPVGWPERIIANSACVITHTVKMGILGRSEE